MNKLLLIFDAWNNGPTDLKVISVVIPIIILAMIVLFIGDLILSNRKFR